MTALPEHPKQIGIPAHFLEIYGPRVLAGESAAELAFLLDHPDITPGSDGWFVQHQVQRSVPALELSHRASWWDALTTLGKVVILSLCGLGLWVLAGCGDQAQCRDNCYLASPRVKPERVCWTDHVIDQDNQTWLETCCIDVNPNTTQPPDCFLS